MKGNSVFPRERRNDCVFVGKIDVGWASSVRPLRQPARSGPRAGNPGWRQFRSGNIGTRIARNPRKMAFCRRNCETLDIARSMSGISGFRRQTPLSPWHPRLPCPNNATSKLALRAGLEVGVAVTGLGESGHCGGSPADRSRFIFQFISRIMVEAATIPATSGQRLGF